MSMQEQVSDAELGRHLRAAIPELTANPLHMQETADRMRRALQPGPGPERLFGLVSVAWLALVALGFASRFQLLSWLTARPGVLPVLIAVAALSLALPLLILALPGEGAAERSEVEL